MDKIYYTVYKVTNKINGKFYIGTHKTGNLDDGYMGSGKYLRYAQEKHGMDNFTKEILHVFDSPEEMFSKEAEIVNEDFLAEENTYNLKKGGFGGWDYINQNRNNNPEESNWFKGKSHSKESREKIKKNHYSKCQIKKNQVMDRIRETRKKKGIPDPTFSGRKHKDETRRIIGEKNSHNQKGSKNSQYGTMWINNPELKESKRIPKDSPLPDGWIKGAKFKWD